MGVKISLQGKFKHLLKDKDVKSLAKKEEIGVLDALNILIKDESWLSNGDNRKMITMIGVRIPVQSTNSMEYIQVYEFLPESTGNVLIPPSELVVKAGSDYDVDKMTVSFPSISNVGGQPYYDKALDNKLSKEELIKAKKELADKSKELQDSIKERYNRLKNNEIFKKLDISEQKELDTIIEEFDNKNNETIEELENYIRLKEIEFTSLYANARNTSYFRDIESSLLMSQNNLLRLRNERNDLIVSFLKEKKHEKVVKFWERQNKL